MCMQKEKIRLFPDEIQKAEAVFYSFGFFVQKKDKRGRIGEKTELTIVVYGRKEKSFFEVYLTY